MTTTTSRSGGPAELDGADTDQLSDLEHRPSDEAPPGDEAPPSSDGGWVRTHAHRFGLGTLLVATGLLYLVGLSESGWANEYYSAAASAGSKSWTAFLFGSLDSSNFITVDKPPASLWVMDISVRIFGLNSWSILVPQALMGVGSVALLYAAVKRVSTPTAGLLAGAILATTPVATLMFRFNNPDALLVLLMTAAAYATVRAIEGARPRWMVLAGVLLGFAFLTKMMQGFLVVPAFAIAYLVAAPTTLRKRILHLLGAGAAMFAAAGWWIALVELWPAGSRPYIGGSTNNSVLELIFGYNGIGRLTGSNNNGAAGGVGTGGFSSSETGWTRMFGSEMGTQISWLLPTALVGIAAIAWLCGRAPRVDRLRASLIVWGGWVLCTGLVLSFASGIIHPYYSVALAPGIAATVALAVVSLWRARSNEVARWVLAAMVVAAAWWTFQLLGRASDWTPWLRWAVVLLGAAAAILVLLPKAVAWLVAPLIAGTMLLAPTAYSLQTASTAHSGALPSAGPTSTGSFGAPGGGGFPGGGTGAFPGGTTGGTGAFPGGTVPGGTTGGTRPNFGGKRPTGGFPGGAGGGAMGGLGGATSVSSALKTALNKNAGSYKWVAATVSANNASSLELGTGNSVMALGGYNGTDDAITLAQFKQLVAGGKIHYFVADQQGFIGSTKANTSTAYAIQQWVTSTYKATTIGATTVYDLTAASK